MSKNGVFNSLTIRVPELRRDLQMIPVESNGQKLLYFHDSMGYIPQNFTLDESVAPLFSMISGAYSVTQIDTLLNNQIAKEELLGFIQLLDENLLLNSPRFREQSEKTESAFEKKSSRPPVLAGSNYPDDPAGLDQFFARLFSGKNGVPEQENVRALYAPHIDLSVNEKLYAEAFSKIRSVKPKRVVILGTSHYAGFYKKQYKNTPFIGSAKSFRLPGRTFEADRNVLNSLASNSPENGFTLNDRAHRVEHSIEIHLLFASAIWKHNFTIVPILVAGFDELFYHTAEHLAGQICKFTEQLNNWVDEDTFILISGDLSHVGRKFGDANPAEELRPRVTSLDNRFLGIAEKGNPEHLLDLISKDYDSTRICGFPPLYTFLKLANNLTGKKINYSWWDESERQSAVSFGSILYNSV